MRFTLTPSSVVRTVLLLAVAMLIGGNITPLHAQFRTGIKIGANFSQWKYTAQNINNITPESTTNFSIASVNEIGLGSVFALQAEPMYTRRNLPMNYLETLSSLAGLPSGVQLNQSQYNTLLGTNVTQSQFDQILGLATTQGGAITYTQELASFSMPITLKVYTAKTGIRGYFFAGPSISLNLSASVTPNVNILQISGLEDVTIKPQAKSAFLGADVGVGSEIPLGIISLVVDARYSFVADDLASFTVAQTRIGAARANDIRIFAGLLFNF